MSSGILSEVYNSHNYKKVVRQNVFEVWYDIFSYSRNLNGNWFYSQEIFDNYLTPTAIEQPVYFAECIEEMVKTAGIKIRYRHRFYKALRTLKRKSFDALEIKRALTILLNSGLKEICYAENTVKVLATTI